MPRCPTDALWPPVVAKGRPRFERWALRFQRQVSVRSAVWRIVVWCERPNVVRKDQFGVCQIVRLFCLRRIASISRLLLPSGSLGEIRAATAVRCSLPRAPRQTVVLDRLSFSSLSSSSFILGQITPTTQSVYHSHYFGPANFAKR